MIRRSKVLAAIAQGAHSYGQVAGRLGVQRSEIVDWLLRNGYEISPTYSSIDRAEPPEHWKVRKRCTC